MNLLYFFSSSFPGVFFLFLNVVYRLIPGTPLSFCSVHSTVTTIRAFDFLAIVTSLARFFARVVLKSGPHLWGH
jgi:hypothetical protein